MSVVSIFGAQPRAQLEVALWRYGWIWLLVGMTTLIALPAGAWWWQAQQQELEAAKSALEQAKAEQARRRSLSLPALQSEGEDAILAQLGQNGYADTELSSVLRSISQIAKAEGLVLAQSDFQTISDSHGGLRQVQLTFPVGATYPKLRRFVEEVLRQLHGVSVDHLGLKREAVSQGQIDVRLKLSIWIDPFKTVSASVQNFSADKSQETSTKQAAGITVNRKVQQ